MIRIHRGRAPKKLRKKGANKRRGMSNSFNHHEADYKSGARTFDFDRDIYAHEDVKERLIAIQHGKCAFCESKITHIDYGDVEHFRPKAGYRQHDGDPLERPGYYWLAYEWTNLLLSCTLCNQRHKKNLFPLRPGSPRATSHRDDIADEEPLLIDPGSEEPDEFITWRAELPRARNGNERARETIEALGLARPALNERRLEQYSKLKTFFVTTWVAQNLSAEDALPEALAARLDEHRHHLERSIDDSAEYAAMKRAALGAGFGYY